MKLGNSAIKKHHPKKNWMQEHVNDHYVQKANAEGWRSRAVFKLSEIDTRDKLLRPGMTVVDLGSAPGSWCQYAAKRIQPGGRLIALDILEMDPIPGVEFIQGDFRDDAVLRELEARIAGRAIDLVLSDMAPNISGIAMADQARATHLAELALDFARGHLKPGGDMLIKVFQGSGFTELREAVKRDFEVIHMRKPAASRDRSPEVFLLARKKRQRTV
ncbi:23S rRNA methyltransferase [Georgfuchsia toluolica]|uniref:Ribosomal RNA large subunit methyltransferase E n=1 Tax=Georgfuchsia toluolica TaxID=424218 RepID=A0A916J663_9PROT|nr:SAM-dependent methyltransferase [Georgfuchsia toluolica]CAG4883146.1 23S rRNA methyltransferase [Georgfuchsia toluolica]